jgi:hypothetical protein
MRANFYERNRVTEGRALLGGVGLEIDGGCYEKKNLGVKKWVTRLSLSKKRVGGRLLRRPSSKIKSDPFTNELAGYQVGPPNNFLNYFILFFTYKCTI